MGSELILIYLGQIVTYLPGTYLIGQVHCLGDIGSTMGFLHEEMISEERRTQELLKVQSG